MIHLNTFSERMYIGAMRKQAREQAERLLRFQVVIESVHPGHFGPLPPSPEMLEHKAYVLGLQPWQANQDRKAYRSRWH